MTVLGFVLSYAGLAALCLAMSRHHRQLAGRAPGHRSAAMLRVLGAALLAASLVASCAGRGMAVGPVLWAGFVSLSAATLIVLLAYAPRLTGAVGILMILVAVVAAAAGSG